MPAPDPPDTPDTPPPPQTPATPSRTPWYGDGLGFTCTQCGNCCTGPRGYVWFSPEEGRAIADFLGITEHDFLRTHARRELGRWTLDETRLPSGLYDCIYLERDDQGRGRCSIYPVRPTQCRTWPFWASNLRSRRAWDRAATGCPGMAAGGNFVPTDQIRIILATNPPGL